MARREPPFPKIVLDDGREAYCIHDGVFGEAIVPVDDSIFAAYRESAEDGADGESSAKEPTNPRNHEPKNGC